MNRFDDIVAATDVLVAGSEGGERIALYSRVTQFKGKARGSHICQ